ncbi:hypothetical protein AGMMS50276_01210 [Synergistales bacterium]|nr:hypothetical protein AGMMS50276_01210 [Synergistales bacterium]
MDNNETTSRPLDHATARIVTELAAAILEPLKEDIKKTIHEAIELKISVAAKSCTVTEPLSSPAVRPETSEISRKTEISEDLQQLLRALSEDIRAWEGILKAEGVAQTRELSEFSSEISDLVKDIKSSLPFLISQAVCDASEKNINHGERLQKLTEGALSEVERRLLKLEKIALISGVILAFLLIVALTVRVM